MNIYKIQYLTESELLLECFLLLFIKKSESINSMAYFSVGVQECGVTYKGHCCGVMQRKTMESTFSAALFLIITTTAFETPPRR